jgi:hypothetical protein
MTKTDRLVRSLSVYLLLRAQIPEPAIVIVPLFHGIVGRFSIAVPCSVVAFNRIPPYNKQTSFLLEGYP